jgi:hypothetical protein
MIKISRLVIFSLVLNRCKVLPLTGREKHRLRVSENKVLRKLGLYGPKREEITGGRRTFHNEELHDLKSSPNTIRVIKARRTL